MLWQFSIRNQSQAFAGHGVEVPDPGIAPCAVAVRLGGGVSSEADGPVTGWRGHTKDSGPSAKPSDPATPPQRSYQDSCGGSRGGGDTRPDDHFVGPVPPASSMIERQGNRHRLIGW